MQRHHHFPPRGPQIQGALRRFAYLFFTRFDRLGFKVGDAVVCLYHGPAEFWEELLLARDGYQATFRVLAAEGIAGGCEQARGITIPGRSLIGSASEASAHHPLKQTVGATVFSAAKGRKLRSQQPPAA